MARHIVDIFEFASSRAPVTTPLRFQLLHVPASSGLQCNPGLSGRQLQKRLRPPRAAHPVRHDVHITPAPARPSTRALLDRQHRVLIMLAHAPDVGHRRRSQPYRATERNSTRPLNASDRRPAVTRIESDRAANRLLEPRRDDMRGIELDADPLPRASSRSESARAREPRVEYHAGGKKISARFYRPVCRDKSRRGVAVVENRLALQLVVGCLHSRGPST